MYISFFNILSVLRNTKKFVNQHNLDLCVKNELHFESFIKHPDLRLHYSNIQKMDQNQLIAAKKELLNITDESIVSVMPNIIMQKKVTLSTKSEFGELVINNIEYPLTKCVYLIGFGKAVMSMAYYMEQLLGTRIVRGILSVPRPSPHNSDLNVKPEFKKLQEQFEICQQETQMMKRSKIIEYYEGGINNQPDEDSLATTNRIVELLESINECFTLIVLITGGGSALLTQPKPPLTYEKKRELCMRLQNAGADITELNTVRIQLSNVKGGGLAKIAYPCKVISLILSDIVNDPLQFIASGPTYPVTGGKEEAINVLKKYSLYDDLEVDIKNILESEDDLRMEKIIDQNKFKHVDNIIIGNNEIALKAASETAKSYNLHPIIFSNTINSNVKDLSFAYAKFARIICCTLEGKFSNKDMFTEELIKLNVIKYLNLKVDQLDHVYNSLKKLGSKSLLLLGGGEPTVIVQGSGKGGRNQELALQFSLDWLIEISKNPLLAKYFTLFLSVGTDGQDGPTDAAGAFGYAALQPKILKMIQDILERKKSIINVKQKEYLEHKIDQIKKVLPENSLKNNDSYNFYSKFECGKNHVKSGLTGTNVMDLHFLYICKKNCDCDILKPVKNVTDKTLDMDDFLFDEIVLMS